MVCHEARAEAGPVDILGCSPGPIFDTFVTPARTCKKTALLSSAWPCTHPGTHLAQERPGWPGSGKLGPERARVFPVTA